MGVSLLAASIIIKSKYCWWNPILINISTSCSHANIVSSFGSCLQRPVWFMPWPSGPQCYLLCTSIAGWQKHCREQCLHLWLYSILAETFRLFRVCCFICSLFSMPFLLLTQELLTVPSLASAQWRLPWLEPISLGGPGQPHTGVSGNSQGLQRKNSCGICSSLPHLWNYCWKSSVICKQMFARCSALFYFFSAYAGHLGGMLGHIYFLDFRNLHWAFTKMYLQIINHVRLPLPNLLQECLCTQY